jgi:hypothetical protein
VNAHTDAQRRRTRFNVALVLLLPEHTEEEEEEEEEEEMITSPSACSLQPLHIDA